MANIMDPTNEPSKWVCRLLCEFDSKEKLVHGTGFLVNMPDTNMYCIMTAGHNIKRPEGGYAIRIRAEFTNKLILTAHRGEYFVSQVFHTFTTLKQSDDSSISDYGLITIDREKAKVPAELDLRGCAFSSLYSESDLVDMECTVHGYKEGSPEQTKNQSGFQVVRSITVSYTKETKAGVSGGPVFVSQAGSDIAVAIHNYTMRATRLTFSVLLEMLSWIKDYGLVRTLQVWGSAGMYLHATAGSPPNILARPGTDGFSTFKFVVVSAAKNDAQFAHHRFALLPADRQPDKEGLFYFLTLDEEKTPPQAEFREIQADIGPCKGSTFALNRKGKTESFRLTSGLMASMSLAVTSSVRGRCECGCISRDDLVGFHATVNSTFVLSPGIKDRSPKRARARGQ